MIIAVLLAAAASASPAPSPTATLPPAVFAGVTLGESAAQLIAQRGEPMFSQTLGENGLWFYFSPAGGSMEMIGIRRGYVSGVGVAGHKTDPPALPEDIAVAGVHLGGPASAIPATAQGGTLTADGIIYSFKPAKDGKSVVSITARLPDTTLAGLPALTEMPLLHDGSSFADAVVLHAENDALGVVFENGFMAGHDFCNPAKWKELSRSTVTQTGKRYDVLNAGCDNGSKTQTIYFDVTAVPTAAPAPQHT